LVGLYLITVEEFYKKRLNLEPFFILKKYILKSNL